MSNFKKSVIYSTTVLAAGLIAISAIYNTIPKDSMDGSMISSVEPAAGDIVMGSSASEETSSMEMSAMDAMKEVEEMAEATIEDAAEELDEISTAAGAEAEEMMDTMEEKMPSAEPSSYISEMTPVESEVAE